MSENLHEHARQLISRSQVEAVSSTDLKWLEAHLSACPACAERAAGIHHAVQAIRSVSVRVNPALVERTRLRVRRRGEEMAGRTMPGLWLWVGAALSWAWIAASASYLWGCFGSLAHRIGIPSPVWQMGFVLWWTVPAVAVAVVLSMRSLQDADPLSE